MPISRPLQVSPSRSCSPASCARPGALPVAIPTSPDPVPTPRTTRYREGSIGMAASGAAEITLSARDRASGYEREGHRGSNKNLSAAVIAMIGHDLRQPLQVIMAAQYLLARRADPDAQA